MRTKLGVNNKNSNNNHEVGWTYETITDYQYNPTLDSHY